MLTGFLRKIGAGQNVDDALWRQQQEALAEQAALNPPQIAPMTNEPKPMTPDEYRNHYRSVVSPWIRASTHTATLGDVMPKSNLADWAQYQQQQQRGKYGG